jgi:hypothetical protein
MRVMIEVTKRLFILCKISCRKLKIETMIGVPREAFCVLNLA